MLLVCLLLSYGRLSAQCSVTISTNPDITQLSCTVKDITLTANTSAKETVNYSWSTGGPGSSIKVSDAATYTVTITDDTGCVSKSSIVITKIDDAPVITAYAFPNKICRGDTVLLASLGAAATYSWSPGSLPGSTVKVVPATTTTYTVTATASNGCTGTGTVQVTVNSSPTASVTGTATVCQNTSQPLITFRALSGTPPYTFAYTLNDGFVQKIYVNGMGDVASIPAPTGVLGTFTYKLVSIDGNGCTQAQNGTATVTVLPGPSLTSLKSASVCNNVLFAYKAESSAEGTDFSWTRPAVAGIGNPERRSISSANINDTLHNLTSVPIVVPYIFTLSTGTGCVVTDTLKVTVNPTPVINPVDSKRYCNGTYVSGGISFASLSSGAFFSWTNSDPSIGLPTRGNGNIQPFKTTSSTNNTVTATIVVTAYLTAGTDTCAGASTTFTITVLPAPLLTSKKDTSVCNNAPFSYTATSSATVTTLFSWTRPAVAGISNPERRSISLANINDTLHNLTSAPIVVPYIFTLSTGDGCGAITDTLKVTVNPTPVINHVNDTTFCNGVFVSGGILFTSPSPGVSFSWTNSNPSIGLPAIGNGNILPFNAANNTNNPVIANITVSIKVGIAGCAGADSTFTITVLPAPLLTSNKTTSVCNNVPFSYTATSSAEKTSYRWIRPAVAGISNRADTVSSATINEILINTSSFPVAVNYIFTLSSGTGCGVTTDTLKVTVNPTPVINRVNDTTFCNGTFVKGGIPFTSPSRDVSFSWTNSNPSIDLPAEGNGDILPFMAVNNDTNNPVTATIIVSAYSIAGAATCAAADKDTFTITVRPAPVLISIKAANVCNDVLFNYTAKSAEGTSFSWTRPAVAGISNPAGGASMATISETLHNTTPLPVVVMYHIRLSPPGAGGCETRDTLKVTVSPTPVINQVRDTVFCNGFSASRGILFSSSSPGVSFKWKSNNSNIGLPDSGTGNILPFIARNTTDILLKATITVSIKVGADSCAGRDTTFTITVRPALHLVSSKDKDTSICNNVPFIYTARSSAVGTNFSWQRDPVNNVTPARGSGLTATINETLYNSGTFKVVVPYIFTLPGNEIFCETKDTLKVTVTPTPVIDTIRDITICNGDLVNVPFTSKSPEVTYSWTNSNPNIGLLPTNGKGIIFPFKATNNTNNPDTATIIVAVDSIAGVANCAGAIRRTFKIIVRPGPLLVSKKDTSICNNTSFIYTAISSAAGTTFNWQRAQVAGITPDTNKGSTATVRETLINSSSQPLSVKYKFDLSTDIGCSVTKDSVYVTVNPTVRINPIDPAISCNYSVVQAISFSSNVNNALLNWNWMIDQQIGLGLGGNGNSIPAFSARISDTASVPVSARVTVTASVGTGCSPGTTNFPITVYPRPVLTSPKTASVCNNTPFNYTAKSSSSAAQTNISWFRNADRDNPGRSGSTGAVSNDILRNNGLQPITVTYHFTLSVAGSVCPPEDSVLVTVNPTPTMDTINPRTYCNGIPASGILFHSNYPDSSFNWSSDISVGFGLGNKGSIPDFTPTNTGAAPVTALIKVSVTAYGRCPGSADEKTFKITVNPSPQRPAFTSLFKNPDNVTLYVCNGSENINFNVNSYNPAVNYTWSSTPGSSGVNIKNPGDSNTVISFSSPGNDTIILTAILPLQGGCTSAASQVVHVSDQLIEIVKPSPIILMQPGNLLVYKQNSLTGYQYQWGYDSVINNASKSFVRPVPVQGQVYQYFIPGTKFIIAGNLNTVDYNYWVLLTLLKNDTLCPTRAYYNGAYRSRIIADPPAEDSTFKLQIIPNPNRGVFEISLKGKIYGSILAQIQNAKGQVVFTKRVVKTTLATTEKLDAGNLPAGVYFLVLYNQHHTPITSRFVIQR